MPKIAFLPRKQRFDPRVRPFACIFVDPTPSLASKLLVAMTGDLGTSSVDAGGACREHACFQMADRFVARRPPLLAPVYPVNPVRVVGFVNKHIAYEAIRRTAAELLKEHQLLTRVNVCLATDRRSITKLGGYNVQNPPSGAATASLAAALVGG